jgi:hypothetical protein
MPVQGHAFVECGSPVLFADMPLDNRTVNEFEGVAATLAFSGRLKPHRERNDLIFRPG